MELIINAQTRQLNELHEGSTIADLVLALAMQADRIALECNGAIVSRREWADAKIREGDRLEIVQFVGGGSA